MNSTIPVQPRDNIGDGSSCPTPRVCIIRLQALLARSLLPLARSIRLLNRTTLTRAGRRAPGGMPDLPFPTLWSTPIVLGIPPAHTCREGIPLPTYSILGRTWVGQGISGTQYPTSGHPELTYRPSERSGTIYRLRLWRNTPSSLSCVDS